MPSYLSPSLSELKFLGHIIKCVLALLQGRSGLSQAVMLKKLHDAVAEIEQMKADLVGQGTGRPAKHPSWPGAAPHKKKRKALNMAPWQPSVGRHAQPRRQLGKAPAAEDGDACFELILVHAAGCVSCCVKYYGLRPSRTVSP